MGKNTWESLPKKPLLNRINIVVSTTLRDIRPHRILNTFEETLVYLSIHHNAKKIFVIGGGRLYKEAINHPNCSDIYVTEIYKTYNCDTFFPKINNDLNLTSK